MTTTRRRIGLIVPSSNVVVEDVWAQSSSKMLDIACHFARISVTSIHQDEATSAQFEQGRLMAAADLLAELSPDLIVWAGTAAAWLGFERDLDLCAEIKARTGIEATTSLLAVNDALHARRASRIALITPYSGDTEAAIVANYEATGISVVERRRLELTVNTDFAAVPPERLAELVEDVSKTDVDAILILCTNLRGGEAMERISLGQREQVIDSVLATFQKFGDGS